MSDARVADLLAAAQAVQRHAYAPYSRFHVGAALLGADGHIYAGANVENAAYPQSQCAEASAIGAMVAAGCHGIAAVLVLAPSQDGSPVTPCGGCRQRLAEFAGPEVAVHLADDSGLRDSVTMGELLPMGFSARALIGLNDRGGK